VTRTFDAAIIGAGASGTLTAVQFARLATGPAHGALIEAGARAARGLAYGTPYGAHLLNVPAGRMSALPDQPDHFLRWLRTVDPGATATTFAPRSVYGDYLASLLGEEEVASRVERVGGTAVGLTRAGSEWIVHLHDDRKIVAQNVVLALGNLPPSDPLHLDGEAPEQYVADPWAPGAAVGLAHDATVLLIGTGLTAVDVAIALRHEGHRGRIVALSRNGRLPQAHAPFNPRPLPSLPAELHSPRGALRWVRSRVEEGAEWRAVIDSVRPHTSAIWQRWTPAQRGSFYRHAKNLWDVHRHRAAPEVRAELDVDVMRGRIASMRECAEGIEVEWRPTGSDARRSIVVARVINCTGPASDYARLDLPLVVQMRRAGWLTPDPLRLGIETDEDGGLLDHDGRTVPGLFTLGPVRRAALWESTAIPEIREQAAALAKKLTAKASGFF
jgi:uncharacterized NAD(P)/FAD-binding protein YdhS